MPNPWKNAHSLADLGQAMADWLGGRGPVWPGYCASDVEDETRHLIPTLVACNRAGYVTTCSQPGHPPTCGYDGRMWRQRAAVDGWIADQRLLGRIRAHANRRELTVITHRPGDRSHPGIVVTDANGEPSTQFGWTPGHRRLIASEWGGVGRGAIRELRTATHLTLVDPVWGRDDRLWTALDLAAKG